MYPVCHFYGSFLNLVFLIPYTYLLSGIYSVFRNYEAVCLGKPLCLHTGLGDKIA